MKLIKRIPKTGNCRFVNDVVCRSVYEFLGLVTSGDVAADVLVNVMVTRDEITLIHSQIVSQIAELLLNEIFDKAPELLIGCLGLENLVDVLENRNLFETYLSQAIKLFDIGKLKDADIVNKQSRRLTEKEYARIYMHAEAGAEIVKNIDELAQFYPIVLGHHKSWNGKMGYPTYFDTTKEKNRFLIELVHLSDCLDAATDFIGRSYKNPKTFEECLEEFIQGSGSLYCPDLVNLIVNNVSLQKKLKKLLNEDRIRTYDEVYGIALDPKQAKIAWEDVQIRNSGDEKDHIIDILHERNKANDAFVKAVVRQTILTLEVDLRSGDFRVYSQNAQRLFPHIENGKYQTFLSEYLEPLCFKQDWDKLEYQLRFSQILHTLVRQNGVFECELRLLIDGAYRWVRLQFLKSDEENIIPKTMLILISDVQEMHFRKEQMESVLKEAYETAVQANQVKSRFMSNMSHDIRTPMNGIMGMTQIALHHLQDSARVEDCLRKIEESSRDLMELVNEVLDMSRIESGKTQLEMDNVCVKDVLQSSIDVCMPMLESAMHTLCVDIDTLGEDVVITDPVRLRQIFINILSNAIKYTPNHGTITIHGKKVFEHAEDGISYYLTFQDTGIGMSKAFQKRVFEPFARESTAYSSSVQGTGLGLSIVKSMVDMMGGTINMDSEVGKGTKFSITLQFPLASEKSISKQVEHINKRFDGTRVLLAEDNAINREIADEILSSIGVKVDHAKDGNEVVEMFQHSANGQYDLIFMDIQMPYKNGYEATTCIRALDKEDAKTIPIIALSANVFKEDITKALQSGMNDHLKKPIEMGALCKVLELYIHK